MAIVSLSWIDGGVSTIGELALEYNLIVKIEDSDSPGEQAQKCDLHTYC